MPPKGVKAKGKAKAKGKGKRGGRGGGRGAGRGAAAVAAAPVVEGAEGAPAEVAADGAVTEGALVVVKPKAKAKGFGALRKKVIDGLGEKDIDAAMKDTKESLAKADGLLAEAKAFQDAQAKQEQDAKKELEDIQAKIAAAGEKEAAAAKKWSDLKAQKQKGSLVDAKRMELLEAQKKLALLEVMAINHARMQELEAKRKAATEAAEAAKRHLMEQRQKEKEALEATKRALAEAKAAKKRKPDPAAGEAAQAADVE